VCTYYKYNGKKVFLQSDKEDFAKFKLEKRQEYYIILKKSRRKKL